MPQTSLDQSDAQLVAEACGRAAQVLGLSSKELSEVLSTHQANADGKDLDPQTGEGLLNTTLLLARKLALENLALICLG